MFAQEGKPLNENRCLGTSCRRLDLQPSYVSQITSQLSPFILSSVHLLSIKKAHNSEMPSGGDSEEGEDVDSAQWLEPFQPFRHLTQVRIWEKRIVPGIVQALVTEEGGVLPELSPLHLSGYRKSPYCGESCREVRCST